MKILGTRIGFWAIIGILVFLALVTVCTIKVAHEVSNFSDEDWDDSIRGLILIMVFDIFLRLVSVRRQSKSNGEEIQYLQEQNADLKDRLVDCQQHDRIIYEQIERLIEALNRDKKDDGSDDDGNDDVRKGT